LAGTDARAFNPTAALQRRWTIVNSVSSAFLPCEMSFREIIVVRMSRAE
jgi:hypothetical protein